MRELIESVGFEVVGECAANELVTKDEVRAMCAAGKCHMYDKNWACPPACGDIAYYQSLIDTKTTCYVAQTFGELEDDFDFEGMMDIEQTHRKRFLKLHKLLQESFPGALVLSAGTCTLCKECSYPDEPCRHPDTMMVSMESAGLVVAEVCTSAQVPYYHGKATSSFTGCVLV